MLTTEDADALIAASKVIGDPVRWILHSQRRQRFRFDVVVLGEALTEPLRLSGTRQPGYWSYALHTRQGQVLRQISTPHDGHPDPDSPGSMAQPDHKHRWTTEFQSASVYVPSDITWDDPHQALLDFLKECNIETLHEIVASPVQIPLG